MRFVVLFLAACSGLPAVRLDGAHLINDGDRSAIAKVTCSRKEFDGDYDRNFVVAPGTSVVVPRRDGTTCAIESVDLMTPEELRIEVLGGKGTPCRVAR